MSLRTKLAVAFTGIYLCGLALLTFVRAEELFCLSLNELGDFLAGAFGPLALAWLVFGYFQQGDELRQGTEALKLQAQELNASVLQQVEMVKSQQLALENHERSLEPIIYLEYKGSAEGVDGDFDRFVITNQGEYCDEVNISYARSTGDVFDMDVEPLHKGCERRFYLDSIYDPKTSIIVRYRKASGKPGLQRFELFREFDQDGPFSRVRKLPD